MRGVGISACAVLCALAVGGCGYATTTGADQLTHSGATLRGGYGTTKAEAIDTWFQYGPTTAYGKQTPRVNRQVDQPNKGFPFSERVSGLTPGATYHYRACAQSSDTGPVCNGDTTFVLPTGGRWVEGQGSVFMEGTGANVDAWSTASGQNATGTAGTRPGEQNQGPVTCLKIVGNRATVNFHVGSEGVTDRLIYIEDNGASGDRLAVGPATDPPSCPNPPNPFPTTFEIPGIGSIPPRQESTKLISGNFTFSPTTP